MNERPPMVEDLDAVPTNYDGWVVLWNPRLPYPQTYWARHQPDGTRTFQDLEVWQRIHGYMR